MEPFKFGFGDSSQEENVFSEDAQTTVLAEARPVQPLLSLTSNEVPPTVCNSAQLNTYSSFNRVPLKPPRIKASR